MPNWCQNNLKIKGNGEKVLELLELIKDENGDMTFEKLVPTPNELVDEPSPQRDDDKAKDFKEKYGAADWYEWRLANWGCKWDASESIFWNEGEDWMVSFQTPWGPPCEFMKTLSKKFDKMTFMLQFADESQVGSPIGQCIYEGGDEISYIDMNGDEAFGQAVWDEEWVNIG